MASDERLLLVALMQGVANGVNKISRSPAFAALVEAEHKWRQSKGADSSDEFIRAYEGREVVVKSDGIIHVEGFNEPIDLVRLRRTIGNLATSIAKVDDWARQPEGQGPIRLSTARSYLTKSRRTLETLAVLLKSDGVFSAFHAAAEDAISAEEEITGRSRDDVLIVRHEPGDREIALDLAEAYQSLKRIGAAAISAKMSVPGGGTAERYLDDIYRESVSARENIASNNNTTTFKKVEEQHG